MSRSSKTGPRALEWRNITLMVGDKAILRNVSGYVPAGETLAILGPSGSGKTTLLSLLAGVFRSNARDKKTTISGEISISGTSGPIPAKQWGFSQPCSAYIRIVEQYDTFMGASTVWEHLMLNAALRLSYCGLEEREERVVEILARLRLTGFEEVPVQWLSGGQKKRLSVAEELLSNPAVLFLDEPTSGLDATVAREVVEIFYERGPSETREKRSSGGSGRGSFAQTPQSDVAYPGSGGGSMMGGHLGEPVSNLALRSQTEIEEASSTSSTPKKGSPEPFESPKLESSKPWLRAQARVALRDARTQHHPTHARTTIIYTIHQPSSLIWSWFSQSMFLAQGFSLYFGPAANVADYLEANLPGVKCPKGYAESEFVLDTINEQHNVDQLANIRSKNNHSEQEMAKALAFKVEHQHDRKESEGRIEMGRNVMVKSTRTLYAPWCVQFRVLFGRVFADRARDSTKTVLMFVAYGVLLFILSAIYWQSGKRPQDLGARSGALVLLATFPLIGEVVGFMVELLMCPPQVSREYNTKRLYHLLPYWLAKRTGTLLFDYALIGFLFSFVLFFTVGFFTDFRASKLFTLVALVLFLQTIGHSYGVFVGTFTADMTKLNFVMTLSVFPFLMMSPVLAPGMQIPIYLRWITFVSPFQWGAKPLVYWAWKDYEMRDEEPSEADLANLPQYVVDSEGGKKILVLDGNAHLRAVYKMDPADEWGEFYLPIVISASYVVALNVLGFLFFAFRHSYQCSCEALCSAGGAGQMEKMRDKPKPRDEEDEDAEGEARGDGEKERLVAAV